MSNEQNRHGNYARTLHSVLHGRDNFSAVVLGGRHEWKSSKRTLDEMMMACDVIEEHNCCTECPLEFNCVKTETYEDIWNKVSERRIDEFLCFADNIDEILETEAEEEQRAYEEELAELNRGYFRDRL